MGSKSGKFKSDLDIEKAMYMAQQGQPQLKSKTYRAEIGEIKVSPTQLPVEAPNGVEIATTEHVFLQPPVSTTKKLVPILVNHTSSPSHVLSGSVIKVKPIDMSSPPPPQPTSADDAHSIQADEDHERKVKHREKGVRFSDEVIILNGFEQQVPTTRATHHNHHYHHQQQQQQQRNNHKCIKIANILRDAYCANIIVDRRAMKI